MVFWDQIVVKIFSVLTLIGNLLILGYLAYLLSKKKFAPKFWNFLGKNSMFLAFIVAILATGGSLIFSEVLNFSPCILCWFQRIFMYPQVILAGLALYMKDRRIMFYLAALSIIGFGIAGIHYLGQINENVSLPCSAIGYSASCSETFFLQFGYITIPMMALTAFALIIAGWHISRSERLS